MLTAATPHVAALTNDEVERILDGMADSFRQQLRSPILHDPSEEKLDYEDVTFPSLDGVPLEGWFIPAAGSNKIVIANHPMGFSRSGIPADREPWKSVWRASGNDFEVNLVLTTRSFTTRDTTSSPTTCGTSATAAAPTAGSLRVAFLKRAMSSDR